MEYQKVSSVEFSKKLANSHSFNGTSIYDGVFSGPTKVASHVEKDYGEIFGGSRCSSSIPVLHVPELNERKIAVDVKSSMLDYSQIFGGFREFELAVSHDDLSAKSIKKTGSTAETEPQPSNISVENKFVAHEASYGSFDGVKEFKMSYHKANQERRNGTNGTTHVTQLHAVPGYTCVIDEFVPSRMTDGDKPLPSSPSGTRKHSNFSGELREGKHSREVSSVLSSGGAGKQGTKDGAIFQNENNHSRSRSNDILFDATGSRTYPSKMHLPSDRSDSLCNTSSDFKTSTRLKVGSSKGNSSEDATGFCSPTYFEDEVDTNSAAASSAAAVKQAIEEAQARIKIAKEIMERKKGGLQNHVKMRYNDSLRTEERRQGKFACKTNKFQEEVQHKYAKDDTPLHVFAGLGKQNATEGGQAAPSISEKDEIFLTKDAPLGTQGQAAPSISEKDEIFLTKDAPLGTQGDNHNATLMDIKKEELKELKVEKEEGIVAQSVQSVNNHELKEGFCTRKMLEQPGESGEKPKAFEEPHIQVEVEKQMNTVEGPSELKEGAYELKSIQLILDEEEHGKKIITELQDEKEVTLTELQDEKEVTLTELQDEKEMILTKLQDEKEVTLTELQDEKEVTLTELQEKREVTLQAIRGVEHREKKQRREWERNANENKLKVQFGEQEECVQKPRDQEECGMKSMIVLQQEEKEVTFKKTLGVEAHERKQRRLWAQNAHENMLVMQELKEGELMKIRLFKAEQVWLENETKQEEIVEQKEIEIRREDFPQREENEAERRDLFFHEEKGKSSGATCGNLEFEKQQKEASGLEVNKGEPEDFNGKGDAEATSDEAVGQVNVEVRINEFHDEEQIGKKLEENVGLGVQERLLEAEENEQMPLRAYQMEEFERRMKESRQWEETENLQIEIDQREENVNMKVTQEAREDFRNNHESANVAFKRHDKIEIVRETPEASLHDSNDEFLEVPSHDEDEEEMEATSASVEYKETETKENFVDLENDQEEVKFEVAQVVMEHTVIEKKAELPTEAFEHDLGASDTDVRQNPSDRHEKELNTVCNAGNGVEELSSELEEKFEDAEEVEGSMNVREDESDSESSNEERLMGSREDVEATQLHSKFQGKGDSTEIAANIKTSQNPEQYKESRFKSQETGGMEVEGTKQKEVELDQEHVDKIDIAKERKKERDKERVAVERAIREARERAFAEAREKAERAAMEKANAEARRRANVEARERLEKASGKVKSSAEQISMEARLKAERAAVERATAEARMRALEKAMSEKAVSKARNQAVKSPGPYTGNETRPCFASTDSLSKGSGPTKGVHVVPHSTDKFDTANDEAVQRQKARSESHQRISERAAKALAEKNMRDLLAQKEQAERNRLAEALDADVKRWSRGKAGNLRALLSTLQYILGADSGWQPIPLTDLVTTTAVKKAYRKATLVVHPDKLQQRGASIQQKYTCEKVFDLLKEAWNRFNGEER